MRYVTVLVLLLLVAGTLPAQTTNADAIRYGSPGLQVNPASSPIALGVPASTRNYSSSMVRGYFFTAPEPISITQVEVPDTTSLGYQTVAIYCLGTAPPAYSSTIDVTPDFFARWQPTGAPIPVIPPVAINKGDVCVILGACSANNSSSLVNPYGPSAPTVTIGTHTVTLFRCGIQHSIAATSGPGANGVGPLWSEVGGSICAVKASYVIHQNLFPQLDTIALPVMGQPATLQLTSNMAGAPPAFVFLGPGRINLSIGFGRILVNTPWVLQLLVPPVPGTVTLPIPNDPVLMGVKVNWQAFLPGANIGASNGVEWTLGI